jgi:REP element-mobilizing transposase RayT
MGWVACADRWTTMGHAGRYGRRSIRLKGYDYTRDGAYFVTVCTHGRAHVFGTVVNDEMRSNACGREVDRSWVWLAEQYPYVRLDEWIVMPDHIHGIVVITDGMNTEGPRRGGSRTAQTRTVSPARFVDGPNVGVNHSGSVPPKRKPLGRLIGAFKTVSTRRVNDLRSTPGARLWQRNYYDHVKRKELSMRHTREYIARNPLLWEPDCEWSRRTQR